MLSKKHRLPIQKFLTARAHVIRNQYFTVKTFTSALPYSRFGVVISKKVAPRATERNRIKREIFALVAPRVIARSGAKDVLIIVQKGAIIEELQKLLP